jgi:hypothetical protein
VGRKIGSTAVQDVIVRSWSAVGIEIEVRGKTTKLTRSANKLTGEGIALDIKPNNPGQRDDALEGKIDGKTVKLERGIEIKESLRLDRAKADIFHFVTAQMYDVKGRMEMLTGAKAERAVRAVVALIATLESNSAALESYLLSQGITKSNTPAPKATGF